MTRIHHVAAICAAFFTLDTLSAQAVGINLTALTPLSAQITAGTQTMQSSHAPGVLPGIGDVTAVALGQTASVSWATGQDATRAYVGFSNHIQGDVVGMPVSGSAGPHEFLVRYSANVPSLASLELSRHGQVSAGMPWPRVDIDIGNDGTIDIPNLQLATTSVPLGAQPFQVRVILASTLPTNGISSTHVQLILRPENNLTILQTASGCAPHGLGYGLSFEPLFPSSGIQLSLGETADLMVLVLGRTQQPVLLPSSVMSPCLLVPSLDVLLVPPLYSVTTIPLPAAVRPVTFQAQGVGLSASGLLTTNAFSVAAF
jgi:hypothetical protein